MLPAELQEIILSETDDATVRAIDRKNYAQRNEEFYKKFRDSLFQELANEDGNLDYDTGLIFYSHSYLKEHSWNSTYDKTITKIYAKVQAIPGLYVYRKKIWVSSYKDRRDDNRVYFQNEDTDIFWQEDGTLPSEAKKVSFGAFDVLFLKEYMTEQGFSEHFKKRILQEVIENLFYEEGYVAYFFFSVACVQLFNLPLIPLKVIFEEKTEVSGGNYINGKWVDIDVSKMTLKLFQLIHLEQTQKLLLEWI